MIRLAANLSLMFPHLAIIERVDAAAKAGFIGVEFALPYAVPEAVLAARVRDAGVAVALFNMPAGDWGAGDRGIAADPARVVEFRAGVDRALDYAAALDCQKLHIMPGKIPKDVDRTRWSDTFLDNIRFAADRAGGRAPASP